MLLSAGKSPGPEATTRGQREMGTGPSLGGWLSHLENPPVGSSFRPHNGNVTPRPAASGHVSGRPWCHRVPRVSWSILHPCGTQGVMEHPPSLWSLRCHGASSIPAVPRVPWNILCCHGAFSIPVVPRVSWSILCPCGPQGVTEHPPSL